MKILITILVVAVATIIRWQQWNALQQLQAEELALTSKASDPASIGNPGGAAHTAATLKSRADKMDAARTLAKELITLFKEGWKPPSEGFHILGNRVDTVAARMDQLDNLQLRILIEQLRNDPEIDDNHRKDAIRTAAISLSDFDPAAAMTILSGIDILRGDPPNEGYDYVIGKLASVDPLAALAWMRENKSKVNKYEGGRAFVIGLADKDQKLAFQSLLEFQAYELHGDGEYEGNPNFSVAEQIARTARTLEDRAAMLGNLRELADNAGEDPDHVVGYTCEHALYAMAEGVATYGCTRATAWLDSLDLRPGECAQLMRGLRTSEAATKGDVGKWCEWMGGKLLKDEFDPTFSSWIDAWMNEDLQAVEKWLTQAAEGPAKRMTVSNFASMMASRDPAKAARWAETLPVGATTDSLLHGIHEFWEKTDPTAAAAFATKHGIAP